MIIRFYVSDDGEVLSNREHPVTKPKLFMPVVPEGCVLPLDPDKAPPLEVPVTYRIYKAVQIRMP